MESLGLGKASASLPPRSTPLSSDGPATAVAAVPRPGDSAFSIAAPRHTGDDLIDAARAYQTFRLSGHTGDPPAFDSWCASYAEQHGAAESLEFFRELHV